MALGRDNATAEFFIDNANEDNIKSMNVPCKIKQYDAIPILEKVFSRFGIYLMSHLV
jgi:hypothetical protein